MTSVAALSAIFREKKLVSIRIKATDYFHNIFRSRLSDPISFDRQVHLPFFPSFLFSTFYRMHILNEKRVFPESSMHLVRL